MSRRQAGLEAALARTVHVRLLASDGKPGFTGRTERSTADAGERALLTAALRLVEDEDWSCLCGPGPSLELLDHTGECVATLEIHHRGLRSPLWTGEALLADPSAVVRWLEQHGVRRDALSYAITDDDIDSMFRD
jgi:hypothetical protein